MVVKRLYPLVLTGLVLGFLAAPARADVVSHWALDGDLEDTGGVYDNFGVFQGAVDPDYIPGVDGSDDGAIQFDGIDDLVEVVHDGGLPIFNQDAYSVTLWVNGFPQSDMRVFSESSKTTRNPLFNIGTHNSGANGAADIYIRDENNAVLLAHTHSTREAFDGEWHHIAWVDDNGEAVMYIDGVRDATNFSYTKRAIAFDTTSIGGILRDTPSHWFTGAIDDVRVFDHALTAEEIREIVGELYTGCPEEGDTHLESISVEGPPDEGPGTYTVFADGASDDSGDEIFYTYTATSDLGDYLQIGPQIDATATFELYGATWTIAVTVDDEFLCFDEAADAVQTVEIEVETGDPVLVSHLPFDGTLEDFGDAGNEVEFLGIELDPTYEDGRCEEGGDESVYFDGVDDLVRIYHDDGLPISYNRAFSIALWVKGDYLLQSGNDRRVFSEASTINDTPLFNIGTHNAGTDGSVDIYIRNDANTATVSHVHSAGIAFDGEWHHICWVDDYGAAALYIDGFLDPVDFSYTRSPLTLDTTTVGGILRAAASYWFTGLIDDVRLYNYILSEDEIQELLECGPHNGKVAFRRGDVTADGVLTIGDAVVLLNHIFAQGVAPPCPDAADIDDNGAYTIGDAVALLNYQFASGAPPAPPGPDECGEDPTDDQWPPETCVFTPCQ
ncbi:MAG: hypothetical protein JXP34_25325 [Planctomycetes bacterium]|nr:hypothetical protein [Planctomycetota bacterium]